MLPSRHRMRRGDDFVAALRGRRAGGPLLVVAVSPAHARAQRSPASGADAAEEAAAAAALVGLVVSKAVGNAVVRTQVKRRLRHVAARHLDELPPGSRVVLRALPPAADASSAELEHALVRGLGRALHNRPGGSGRSGQVGQPSRSAGSAR